MAPRPSHLAKHAFNPGAPGQASAISAHRRHRARPSFELLEPRELLAADFRTLDGTLNNLLHPDWGSAGVDLLRVAPAAYADGISLPAGGDRPSARAISNAVVAQEEDEVENNRHLSDFIYVFGQFLDHDLSLTPNASPADPFNVPVPTGDPFFDPNSVGGATIGLNRSLFDPATGKDALHPRQQTNVITAWLDGSMIYGSDTTRAAALRTFEGGKLKTSAGDLLPFNTMGLDNQIPGGAPAAAFFAAGDVRTNENVDLTAIHVLFLREHNRLADQIAASDPSLTDEDIYQRARRIVGGELQAITYNEWLPALLGPNPLAPYTGYKPNVNPGIINEFSTAALRIGHTLLGNEVLFRNDQGLEMHAPVPLSNAFFNPGLLEQTGIDPILKYLSTDNAQEIDNMIVGGLRNFLFGPPGAGGFDLASLNIQRGRDHGLADYNSVRAAFGLPRVTSFDQITSNPDLAQKLADLYGDVDHIDLWVGGLAEDHVAGTSVGPLFRRILIEQFTNLRDGDRYWYERAFSGSELNQIRHTTLADVIRHNTTITNIADNAFFFSVKISGRLYEDRDGNTHYNAGEAGLGGFTVELVDEDGNVVDSTTSQADGTYQLTSLDEPGKFHVQTALSSRWTLTTPHALDVAITHAMEVTNQDFGSLIDPDERYVYHLFVDQLDRAPEPAGLAFWSGQLGQGMTRSQAVASILNSQEHCELVVRGLFHQLLHREAEAGGLAYFAALLHSGRSAADVAAVLAGSAEYYVNRGGSFSTGFLNALYSDLGLGPIPFSDRNAYESLLSLGTSRQQVAAQVLASLPARRAIVAQYYREYLGREAAAADIDFWAGELARQGDRVVTSRFALSDEYFARV